MLFLVGDHIKPFHYSLVLFCLLSLSCELLEHTASALEHTASAPLTCDDVGSPNCVEINPGDDIQSIVNTMPAGSTYIIKSGVHWNQRVRPKDGDVYWGQDGALMTGAVVLENFIPAASNIWKVTGLTMEGQRHGNCDGSLKNADPCHNPEDNCRYTGCRYPEDLFVDDVAQFQVETLAEVDSGQVDNLVGSMIHKFYFDYVNDTLYFYLADDPSNHTIELSSTRVASSPTADNVTVRNLIIEKYANPPQMGAIGDQYPRPGWIIEDNEVKLTHGAGITVAENSVLRGNYSHHNGQMGMGGGGPNILQENNEIAYNNTVRFSWGWEGGGQKFANTDGLIVRNNYAHNNNGPGFWTDINNIDTLYEFNTSDCNRGIGIYHEISYDAVIRNNVSRLNGWGQSVWLWGAQILIAASPNVEVHDNYAEVAATYGNGIGFVQQSRGAGPYGPYEVKNNDYHQNEVVYFGNLGQSGSATDYPEGNAIIYDGSNVFDVNTYHAPRLDYSRWAWQGNQNWVGFQGMGQDLNGAADTLSDLVFANQSMTGKQLHVAHNTITAGPNLVITGDAIDFVAGDQIIFTNGVAIGGSFTARISACQ